MSPSPRHCPTALHGDPCSAIGANGFIQVEAAVVDRMSIRMRGKRYKIILKLVELKTSDVCDLETVSFPPSAARWRVHS
jgi:hypothetical protein